MDDGDETMSWPLRDDPHHVIDADEANRAGRRDDDRSGDESPASEAEDGMELEPSGEARAENEAARKDLQRAFKPDQHEPKNTTRATQAPTSGT